MDACDEASDPGARHARRIALAQFRVAADGGNSGDLGSAAAVCGLPPVAGKDLGVLLGAIRDAPEEPEGPPPPPPPRRTGRVSPAPGAARSRGPKLGSGVAGRLSAAARGRGAPAVVEDEAAAPAPTCLLYTSPSPRD